MTDEKLDQAAKAASKACGWDNGPGHCEGIAFYDGFIAGATWQAEQDRAQIEKLREALRNMPCTCVEANPLSGIMVDEVCCRCKTLLEGGDCE
jgi:hypothetical protein